MATLPGNRKAGGAAGYPVASVPALTITTTSPLPGATVGTAYSYSMVATGGVPPYTWSITSDTPDTGSWLAISAAGSLSGTPGTAETENLVIRVTDSASSAASNPYSLTVSAASGGATLVFNYPNFASTNGITYYGNSAPTVTNNIFNIVPYTGSSMHVAEGMWYRTLQSTGPFTDTFQFQFNPALAAPSNPTSGEVPAALTFCIQNSTAPPGFPVDVGLQAVGDANIGGFGWFLNSSSTQYNDMTPGVAVKFDMNNSAGYTYPTGGTPNSTGLYINAGPRQGFTPMNDLNPYGINFWNGATKNVTIVYDGAFLTMTITDNGNGANARFTWPIVLSTILGSQAYFGFTAGSASSEGISILNWAHYSGINTRLATPTFGVAPGQYASTQSVSLSGSPGSTIYYTTNGLVPTLGSSQYTGTPITVASNLVIQAIAIQSGFTDSYVATGAYQINTSNYINFPSGFSANSGMMTVGHSYLSGSQIFICDTSSLDIEAGATWWCAPVPITTFSTTFQLTFSNAVADGMLFVLQDYYNGYNNSAAITSGNASISLPNNQLVNGQPLTFATTVGNITAGTQYFVLSSGGVTSNSFQITTSYNGAGTAIVPTASGNSLVQIPANMANGPFAVGGSQDQMGYGSIGPDPGIQNSVGICFDFYTGSPEVPNSVGLYLNGQSPIGNQVSTGQTFNGKTWNVTVTYSSGTLAMTMVNSANSAQTYSTSWSVNVPTIIGSNSAYAGFTGGTGGLVANFVLNSWTFA